MKIHITYLTLLMAIGGSHSVFASESEDTPDVIDLTSIEPFPAQIDVSGPLSELEQNLILSAFKGELADVETLVNKGVDVNLQDQKKRTPLIFAASAGHTSVVEYLVGAGADVSMSDSSGQPPLLHACKGSFNETATFLLDNGADVNVQSKKRGVTALMLAAVWDNVELAQILLDHGADPQLTDSFGRTAKLLAEKKGNTAVIDLLPDPPESEDGP